MHDGPGIRQTIFFKGCPLNCTWCHNPESRKPEVETYFKSNKLGDKEFKQVETVGKWMQVDEVMESIIKDLPFFEESGGGVTLSGGEPLAQSEFTAELLKQCKEKNIHTAIDTSGYSTTEEIDKVLPFTDLFLYDLKLANKEEHIKHAGRSNEIILKNLKRISRQGKHIHVRIPLIQDITDTWENLEAIKKIILGTKGIERIDLLPCHHIAKSKYERMKIDYNTIAQRSYSKEKAAEIKEFFKNTTPVVSIGG